MSDDELKKIFLNTHITLYSEGYKEDFECDNCKKLFSGNGIKKVSSYYMQKAYNFCEECFSYAQKIEDEFSNKRDKWYKKILRIIGM